MRFNRRQLRGLAIVAAGGQITRVDDKLFAVKSQSSGSSYKVAWRENSWVCQCDDFKKTGSPCKHIWSVLFLLDLPNITLMNSGSLERGCPFCGSKGFVRNGCNMNLSGPVQTYLCKNKKCKKRFRLGLNQEVRGANGWIMLLALDLFNKGVSLRDIQDHLWQLYGLRKPVSTLHSWVLKLTRIATKAAENIKVKVGNRWLVDELFLKVNSRVQFDFNVFDYKTRYHIVSLLAEGRGEDEAYDALMLAVKRVGRAPGQLFSDGLVSYPPAIERIKAVNGKLQHVQGVGIKDKASNNRLERRHNGMRGWTRTKRGMKNHSQELVDGNRVYYNHVRPHMSLDGKPPAPVSRDSRWMDLLRVPIPTIHKSHKPPMAH